ncbi:pyridoxal-phosphate dependent enzyme [Pseudonocardia acaciae]|uniref:pyridoxal-phosphate dependent enzyme n=1 Tax=Pseudonocardia acaciae TaxID=551276 RepID=UPI00048D9F88|nr:pyridoxal-phosphate dependent enzyme [Pseudonocardia acaciae]
MKPDDIAEAGERIAGVVRPVTVARVAPSGVRASLALEFLQFTGSFKARGAANFVLAHAADGTLPPGGVAIASGGNAGLAYAWAAGLVGAKANVFVPVGTPAVKLERLSGLGAVVHRVGTEYGDAAQACREFALKRDVLLGHAYDNRLMAAGAGTLVADIRAQLPGLATLVVAVGGGGLFSGVATAAAAHGIRTVGVEPAGSRALHAGVAAGRPVDVEVDSIAADSLGARRASELAVRTALSFDTRCVLVDDPLIAAARELLWDDLRILVEHGTATALAALLGERPAYAPEPGESVCVVLCGANTARS